MISTERVLEELTEQPKPFDYLKIRLGDPPQADLQKALASLKEEGRAEIIYGHGWVSVTPVVL